MCPQGCMAHSDIPVTCDKMLQGGVQGKKEHKRHVDKRQVLEVSCSELNLYVCFCVFIYVCMLMYVYVCTCFCVFVCLYMCAYFYVCAYLCMCVHAFMCL